MQFIDIKTIHKRSASQIDSVIATVIEHGRYINGPEVYELEATLGEFLGESHCITVSSGTMALEVAMRNGYRDWRRSHQPFHPYLTKANQDYIIETVLAHESK